jgi:hypothetical protein
MDPDPVTEFLKLGSALYKQDAILAPKQAHPLSLLNKRIHPFHLESVYLLTSRSSNPVSDPCIICTI